jgi:hypothetical protein
VRADDGETCGIRAETLAIAGLLGASERADALRILLATTTLALSRPLELLLAPLRIASGSRGVVRLGHGAILTVPESISEGSAWGSGP